MSLLWTIIAIGFIQTVQKCVHDCFIVFLLNWQMEYAQLFALLNIVRTSPHTIIIQHVFINVTLVTFFATPRFGIVWVKDVLAGSIDGWHRSGKEWSVLQSV